MYIMCFLRAFWAFKGIYQKKSLYKGRYGYSFMPLLNVVLPILCDTPYIYIKQRKHLSQVETRASPLNPLLISNHLCC